jgi:hypothetical protein
MIRRSAKIMLEVVIGFTAGLALMGGMALWRLSTGPVQLDFLTPYLENVFQQTRSGISVDVGETVLTWEGWSRTIDLRAREVTVQNAEGEMVGVFPDVSVNLSLLALLRGTVAPTVIEIIGARVDLKRDEDGKIRLSAEQPSGSRRPVPHEAEVTGIMPSLVDLFLREPDPRSPLGYLSSVRILQGQLVVDDRQLETVWVAPEANMELRRHDAGLAALLDLKLALGEGAVQANLTALYDDVRGRVDVTARVAGLRPEVLGTEVSALSALTAVRLPLEANASAVLDGDGVFQSLRFEVTGGAGEVVLPDLLPEPRALAGLSVRGVVDGEAHRLQVESLELRLGSEGAPGPTVSATAVVDGLGEDLDVSGELRVDKLSIGDISLFWPQNLAAGARRWVTKRIRGGTASDIELDFAATLPEGDFKSVSPKRFGGGFAFRDSTIAYYRDLPPVTGVGGLGTIDLESLRFQVTGGTLGEIDLAGGQVDLLWGDWERRRVEIAGDVAGPLSAAFEILDHDDLRLLDRIGIAPSDATGQAEAHLTFQIPLKKGITVKDVEIGAEASVQQAAIASFLVGWDGTDMDLALRASRQGMAVAGTLTLAGAPALIDWSEDFSREAPQRTLLKLDFPGLESADRRALGIDWSPYLEGPVSASVIAKVLHDRSGAVNIAANLASAHLSLPFLNWEKLPGVNGQARATLSLVDGKVEAIERFDVEAGTLLARGRGALAADRRNFQELSFEQLSFHGTTLYNTFVARDGPGFDVALGEGVVDLDSFLEDEAPAEPDDEAPETPVRINGRKLDSLYFGAGRYLQGVELDMERSTEGWERVNLRGEVPRELWAQRKNGAAVDETASEPKVFTLAFGLSEKDDYRLTIKMNDMGAALRALDVVDTVQGGDLVITGVTEGPAPRHPIKGRIEARDYRVIDAPVLAQLLSLASFTGVGSVLSGDGLAFKRLVGKFKVEDGEVTTDLIRAYGGALGLTTKGTIDFRGDRVDLQGTVVPAYTVNRILGKIPLLGWLLVGGEGEGVVAVTYRIRGALDEPQVSVNPLSALTPGFLRGLFGVATSGGEEGEGGERPMVFPPKADR